MNARAREDRARAAASRRRRLCWLLLSLLLPAAAGASVPVPEGAAGDAVRRDGAARVQARLLVHPDDWTANSARVGVLFELAPGWHIYGREPGDSGMATELRWKVQDAEVGPVLWPPVETFEEGDGLLTTYGYSGEVLLTAPVDFASATPTVRGIGVEIAALACKVECVPVAMSLQRTIGVEAEMGAAEARLTRDIFERHLFSPGRTVPRETGTDALGFVTALGFAFVGGLILNLMPCVLPVLALKLFALADLARRRRSEVAAHTAAYTGGVLATLLALGGVVAGLRSAGTAVGWGFQFQEPVFIATIATVLVVLAQNLFGVFEIGFHGGKLAGMGSRAAGARRSFFEGLLVVVLATPCSAPFLGTAIGFAFASPAPVILAIFGAIGLGLAAPYVAIAMMPGWTRFLPRSGEWMVRLRSALGFVLLAVCVWLVWLFGRSAGSDGMAALLLLLLAVSAGVWWIAGLPARGQSGRARLATAALVVGVVAGLGVMRQAFDAPSYRHASVLEGWSAYDPVEVERRLAEGRTVFVAFTADWCITCKLNEKHVLSSEAVRDVFTRRRVVPFVADWTRRDDAIRSELARFGRAGVPLYLAYHPQDPQHPEVLPELLQVEDVIGAVSPPVALGAAPVYARMER